MTEIKRLTNLPLSIKKKWVTALRSRKFKQGEGQLSKVEDDVASYCCLGVLATIVDPSRTFWNEDDGSFGTESQKDLLNGTFIPDRVLTELIGMNDDDTSINSIINQKPLKKRGFSYIASWIERYL